jgi:hypothetical protein
MHLPKDCKQLGTSLAVQAAVADKAADHAGKTKTDIGFMTDCLSEITQLCNMGQMTAAWFTKLSGEEGNRINMMTAEKRFKLVKGILAGAEALAPVATACHTAATEYAAFFPVIAEALEALDRDMQLGTTEGWLNTQHPDQATGAKQRGVFESASWFWALHARLADIQLGAQDKRIEASELAGVTVRVGKQALELLQSIPPAPAVSDPTAQVTQVGEQYETAKEVLIGKVTAMLSALEQPSSGSDASPVVSAALNV